MAVSTVKIRNVSFRSSWQEHRMVRDYEVEYLITTTSALDGPASIITDPHPLLPRPGMYYQFGGEFDIWAMFQNWGTLRPFWDKNHTTWIGVALFSTRPIVDYRSLMNPGDPLAEPTIWSITFQHTTRAADKWLDGTPITNSANEPRFIDIQESWPVITARKNYPASVPIDSLLMLINNVNSNSYWGFPAYTLRVADINISQRFMSIGVSYWDITWQIVHNPNTWRFQFLDEGWSELVNSGGDTLRVPILDDTGAPVREKQFLDGSGRKTNTPTYYPEPPKSIYKEVNFNLLGLPSTIGAPS